MKLHILGICGTFMGGVAALARELGHAVDGSDQSVYPPMSTQLEQLGITLTPGLRRRRTSPPTPTWWWSAMRCRAAMPRSSTCSTRACPTPPAPSGCANTCCRAGARWRWPARTARPPRPRSSPTCSKPPAARPASWSAACRRISACRRASATGADFVVEADEYDTAFFDKRSQVRALPADGGDPQQPRVRPRRHLPGPGRDPAPVPPPGAHRAGQRPPDRQRRGRGAGGSAGDGLLDAGRALRHRRRRTCTGARA